MVYSAYSMDENKHIAEKDGQKYEVIVVGDHENAHGGGVSSESSSEVKWKYECFDCGNTVIGEDADDARAKLADKKCN